MYVIELNINGDKNPGEKSKVKAHFVKLKRARRCFMNLPKVVTIIA